MDINIDSQIVIQTAAQWAADTDVYSEKRILVTSDVYYTGTDQRKFKLANGVDTWSNLDYMPLGGSTTWGGITGTLSDQTDLQNALNNKQDLDSDLTAIAGLTPSNDDIIQRKAGSWINRTLAQLWVDLKDLTVTLTNKTLAVGSNSITGTASRVAQFGAGGSLEASSVTNTQLSYLDATSSIQTQLDNRSTLLAKNNIQVDHTGTTAETKVLSWDLTGKFQANDLLQFLIRPTQSGAGNKTIRIKVNNADSLTGAVTLATYTFTITSGLMIRNMWFSNTLANIKSMLNTTSFASDLATTFATSTSVNTNTFDFTGTTWLIISVELADGANTQNIQSVGIIRTR